MAVVNGQEERLKWRSWHAAKVGENRPIVVAPCNRRPKQHQSLVNLRQTALHVFVIRLSTQEDILVSISDRMQTTSYNMSD